jgi:hypothetical protein
MPSLESLVARIRGEYREMPGLRLTFAQALMMPSNAGAEHSTADALFWSRRGQVAYASHGLRFGRSLASSHPQANGVARPA